MSSTTFIYALCEPGTRTVRYIGKSNNPAKRLYEHLKISSKKNTHLGHWILRLMKLDAPPELVVLAKVPTEDWKEEERRYIRSARVLGMALVNATDGGEGVTQTPEIREKISAKQRGRKGRPHTSESRAKLSAAHTGRIRTPEQCENIRKSKTGLKKPPLTPEHKAKISATMKGRQPPEASLLNLRSPETIAKRSETMKGRKFTLEHCKNIRLSWIVRKAKATLSPSA